MNRSRFLVCFSAVTLVACAGPLDPVPDSEEPLPGPLPQTYLFAAEIKQVTTAEAASFVVLDDGTVWGFTTIPQPALVPDKRGEYYGVQDRTPIRIEELDDVVSMAFRYRHGCALHGNGTVSCWGDNRHGQLGIGSRTSTPIPTRVEGLDRVVQIDVGEEHSCALRDDGQMACWGNRTAYFPHNPLKDGAILDLVPFELANVPPMKTLAISRLHTCAITEAENVQCWGNLWPDDPALEISLAEQVAYRDFRLPEAPERLLHGSCVLQKDGSLACPCQNEESSVSLLKLPCYARDEPVSTFGRDIVSADQQMSQVCGISTDGHVRCQGGYDSPFYDVAPWQFAEWEQITGLESPSAIAVGVDTCVLDDHCVRCFGPWIGRKPLTIGCFIPLPDPPR